MTSPEATGREGRQEDQRVAEVRRELADGWAVGDMRTRALLAAYDELAATERRRGDRLVDAMTHRRGKTRAQYIRRLLTIPGAALIKTADHDDNTDPARLAVLDEATRERLVRKYDREREWLAAGHVTAKVDRTRDEADHACPASLLVVPQRHQQRGGDVARRWFGADAHRRDEVRRMRPPTIEPRVLASSPRRLTVLTPQSHVARS